MSGHLFELLRGFFHSYGYWTVAALLLLEHAGIPLPGETTLLFASFLAYSERQLDLRYIILSGTIAAAIGGELGYLIGRHGGRLLLGRYQRFFRVRPDHLQRGERLFARHGALTVFMARFIFGMRIVAGPLAGVLHMDRQRFTFFNFMGALSWVTAISFAGYFFGSQWGFLMHLMKRVDAAILLVAAIVIVIGWLRWRSRRDVSGDDTPL